LRLFDLAWCKYEEFDREIWQTGNSVILHNGSWRNCLPANSLVIWIMENRLRLARIDYRMCRTGNLRDRHDWQEETAWVEDGSLGDCRRCLVAAHSPLVHIPGLLLDNGQTIGGLNLHFLKPESCEIIRAFGFKNRSGDSGTHGQGLVTDSLGRTITGINVPRQYP
jgi:hypothetical protein